MNENATYKSNKIGILTCLARALKPYIRKDLRYKRKLEKAKKDVELRKIQCEIRKLNKKYHHNISIPTAKLFAGFLFVNFTILEGYSMWVMVYLSDLSSLPTLISTVIGQIITYWIYSKKSTTENSVGGITYDIAMQNLQNQLTNNNDTINNLRNTDESAVG